MKLVGLLFALSLGAEERELVDRIVAIVNEDVVTWSELQEAVGPYLEGAGPTKQREQLMKDALEQLVSDRLLNQQVAEAQITVDDDEVERAIEDICRQNNITREQLRQAVEQRGLAMGQYQEDLKLQLVRLKLIDMKVRSRVVVPESDIRQEYEAESALETREELVQIRHIFLRYDEGAAEAERARVMERAKAARERVVKGESFAEVAKALSEGPTASSGGDLGEMPQASLLPELAKAMKGMKEGQLSQPIVTPNGIHVVLLEARRQKAPEGYEAKKNKIYQRLYQQEVDRQMRVWIDELRAQAAIEIRL